MEKQYTCRQCKSNGPFHPSYLAHSNYLCKPCASKSVKECRTRDPARLLAYRAYNTFRLPITRQMVQIVLERCHYQSVISGENDPDQLCMVPYYKDIPVEEWHCLIVTRQEARSLYKSKDMIPIQLQEQLYHQRQRHVEN